MLCHYYRASEEDAEALTALALATHRESWWHEYGDDAVPDWFSLYPDVEPATSRIRAYEAELIPGLLQTPEYARAVDRARDPDDERTSNGTRASLGTLAAKPPRSWNTYDRKPASISKSSYSGGSGGNCVEWAYSPNGVYIRDSKQPGAPPPLATYEEWSNSLKSAGADRTHPWIVRDTSGVRV